MKNPKGERRIVVLHDAVGPAHAGEGQRGSGALRAREGRFRALFESLTDALLVHWVSEEPGQCRFFEVNDVACRSLGYTREELLGMTPVDVEVSNTGASGASVAARLGVGKAARFEQVYRTKDGRRLPVEVSVRRLVLEGRVAALCLVRDITEPKQAERDLLQSREQLRALAGRIQAVREDERARIAREIHDVLAQELTGLKIDVSLVTRLLDEHAGEANRALVFQKLADMTARTNSALQVVQKIVTELRPVVLDTMGLSAAVEWLARDFATRMRIECRVEVPERDPALGRDGATALFRILQESLTNMARHAAATRVDVFLQAGSEGVVLRVDDNGRGIKEEVLNDPRSFGLTGMRERALLLGGSCSVRGRSGAGTTVEVRLPLPPQPRASRQQP